MNFTELYFKTLSEGTLVAHSYQKIILDSNGDPCDYEFIAINQAMENLFQVNEADVVGKRFSEVYPVANEKVAKWIKTVGDVALHKITISADIEDSLIQKRLRVTLFTLDKYYCIARYVEQNANNVQSEVFPQFSGFDLDMLCVSDMDGNFVKVNKEFENVLGYAVEELEGRNFMNLVHEEDIPASLACLQELDTQNFVESFVNRFRHKNGSYRYIEWRSRGNGKYVYSSARDITQRKLLELELKQTNEELIDLTRKLQEANESLKTRAITDELTGLYNRHFFERKVMEEMERADRSNEPLSLIIFDLDHFKRVNDTWGHPIGDEVLKKTAKVVGNQLRSIDILCRIGGEEFAVILPRTALDSAVVVAEKLRETLDVDLHPKAGKVTGSFGVAERVKAESLRRWYKRADDALYQAKNQSRSCVVACSQAEKSIATVRLEWRDEWASGNAKIDEQHQELLERSSSLITMLYSETKREKVLEQLEMLLRRIVHHFKTEEQMLVEVSYPEVERHAKIHETLVVKALYLKDCYLKGELQAAGFFSFIIDDVVLGHMVKEDMQFFQYTGKK